MKVSSDSNQFIMPIKTTNATDVIRKIYPEINSDFFLEKPNVYDRNYIIGENRQNAKFIEDSYMHLKEKITKEITRNYSEYHLDFTSLLPSETNTSKLSWETVLSGKRPMGQFSVDSLYAPELQIISELPNIDFKLFPKENNDFLYIVVIYRKDSELGEAYAKRFIELYNEKRKIMDSLEGQSDRMKALKSELVIAREMGEILSYSSVEIDKYINNLNLLLKDGA
ncbi:NleE/OspZ family T3SS effector cysteine methyltransferase [Proteus columbae]|uniref:NleE/OspZ family T3SS effector cysteine methyltransferase n=1 Tax=Proteus columbae TaxID=1987580 RepID=UPI0013000C64|nr:NleE/OspZ family T3SS effector cysteine methyltransferase [Proteus columbae]